MRRGHYNQHAGFANLEASQAMDERNFADFEIFQRPPGQLLHLAQRHLFIRLILQIKRSARARMIPHHPFKNHGSPILALLDPFQHAVRIDAIPHNYYSCVALPTRGMTG